MITPEPIGEQAQTGSAARSPSDSADFAAEVDSLTEAVVTRVSTRHGGGSYQVVLAELGRELEAAVVTMPESWLRRVAEDISAGRRPAR